LARARSPFPLLPPSPPCISDPEGNVWDVAWKAGAEFDDRDGFIYP
jgi:hypothetical protein